LVDGAGEALLLVLSTPTTQAQIQQLMASHLEDVPRSRIRDVSVAVWASIIATARIFGGRHWLPDEVTNMFLPDAMLMVGTDPSIVPVGLMATAPESVQLPDSTGATACVHREGGAPLSSYGLLAEPSAVPIDDGVRFNVPADGGLGHCIPESDHGVVEEERFLPVHCWEWMPDDLLTSFVDWSPEPAVLPVCVASRIVEGSDGLSVDSTIGDAGIAGDVLNISVPDVSPVGAGMLTAVPTTVAPVARLGFSRYGQRRPGPPTLVAPATRRGFGRREQRRPEVGFCLPAQFRPTRYPVAGSPVYPALNSCLGAAPGARGCRLPSPALFSATRPDDHGPEDLGRARSHFGRY